MHMAPRAALLGALAALLIINLSCIATVEACGFGVRCSNDQCCANGVCGKGPQFCAASNCDCTGGYCSILCPAPGARPAPPKKRGKKCFPGHATVQLAGGKLKTMEELAVGDRVAVWAAETGRIAYDDVYAFGHKDALVISPFVNIRMAGADAEESGTPSAALELSPGHFVPTVESGTSKSLLYKRAQDVVLGDYLWAIATNSSGEAVPHMVTEISRILKQGAFNPFTTKGSIVVDGVVASVHSDWFLDPLFSWLGIPHHLPAVYQAVLSPARVLYIVLGKELYIATYSFLDAQLNLAELGTNHGGQVVAAGLLAVFAGIFLTVRSSRFKN